MPHPTLSDAPARWRGVRRLLAVRLDNLGDVLMTTPALAALRDSLPGVHITLLASPAGAATAPHLPMIDEVWNYAAPWMRCGSQSDPVGSTEAALIDRIAEARFDAAVVFTVCTQSALPAALICRIAGIPLRLAHCRENPYSLLTDWVPESDVLDSHMRHEVQRQLALVQAVGCTTRDDRLRFVVREADRQSLAGRARAAGVDLARPYVVLHPGATAASRRWPAPRFGAAAAAIAERAGCAAVFSGATGDLALVQQAREAMAVPAASLAGELALGEFAALLEGARALVANNSAPAHLAAALGTPVVNVYALTNPQHTPWRVRSRVLSHDVPCRWCLKSSCPLQHNDCLRRVTPEEVADAALEMMGEPSAAHTGHEPAARYTRHSVAAAMLAPIAAPTSTSLG